MAKSKEEVLNKFNQSDRRFNIVVYLAVAILVFLNVAIFLLQYNQRQNINDSSKRSIEQGRIRDEEQRRYFTCILLEGTDENGMFVSDKMYNCAVKTDLPGGLTPGDAFSTDSTPSTEPEKQNPLNE